VEGYGEAVVAVPLGAREPRRVVVALHGNADRPEWQCGSWRGIAGSDVFVLCPRGVKRMDVRGPPRFTFGTLERTEGELRAALEALKHRYGQHVAPGGVVLTGLGVGATHSLKLAQQEPAFFSRVVAIEGETEQWTAGTAAAFASRGGQRVLFACAHEACERLGVRNVLFTRRNGGDARLVVAGPKARGFDAHLTSLIQQHWSWLIGKDPAAKPSR
jgi:poly(3-hydroxybutyrate) depolymerase